MLLDHPSQTPGATPLRAEMSHVMEFFTKTTLEQYRLPAIRDPTERIILFISSIARTNLEADLVQKGGSLVRTSDSSSEYSSTTGNAPLNTNKPKYVFGESWRT